MQFYLRHQYSLIKLIIYYWLTGAALAVFYVSYNHIKFIHKLKRNSKPLNANQIKIAKSLLNNKNSIQLTQIRLTPLISSPMICHIFHSKIYLPVNFFSHYNANEKSYVLHHECIHFQRFDLLSNAGMMFLLCLNWFNPLLIYSYKYFRGAQELSCDALLRQHYSMFDDKEYGHALLKTAVNESMSSLSCPWNSGSQLKERCLALKFHQGNPVKNLIGFLLLVVFTGTALAVSGMENHIFFEDLHISNFSKNKFTVIANYNCDKKLAEIEKNSVALISQSKIQEFCGYEPCMLVFHLTGNCSGEPIAGVGLNMQGGISSISVDKEYNFTGNNYNLMFYERFTANANRNNVAGPIVAGIKIKR